MCAEMILKVPIQVDGLYIESPGLNLGSPMADFSLLPYNVDIHEHLHTIHFGVDSGDDPSKLEKYSKKFRDLVTHNLGAATPLSWKSIDNIADVAGVKAKAANSADFGFVMIEGAEKVRFIKS